MGMNYNKTENAYDNKKTTVIRGERKQNNRNNGYSRTGGRSTGKSYGKPSKPYGNHNGFKKPYRHVEPVNIDKLKQDIINEIQESVDGETFYYRYNLNEKKKVNGIIGISLKVYLKEDQKKERYLHLYIVQDRSKKTSVMVTDGALSSATVLFYTISNDPTEKVLKFIPSLVESLQKLTLELR